MQSLRADQMRYALIGDAAASAPTVESIHASEIKTSSLDDNLSAQCYFVFECNEESLLQALYSYLFFDDPSGEGVARNCEMKNKLIEVHNTPSLGMIDMIHIYYCCV